MKSNKLLILVSSIFISNMAAADIIKCMFTEPFGTSTYSMTQSVLKYDMADSDKSKTIKNVSFQIKAAGEFELISKEGKVLQKISLTKNGSDGMSDRVYPYEVKDSGMATNANNGTGGCSSNHLK